MSDETIGRAMRLRARAMALPRSQRKDIIKGIVETELHKCLKEMLSRIYPNATVEITHGPDELGKDLVIIREDPVRQHGVGLVVARGDIKGKTSGLVDKIKSQVEQSLSHPANPTTFFKDVPITEAWVVLAGQMSGGARKRLSAELQKDVVVFDIEWLTDSFTEHYPEVFFEGRLSAVFETLIENIELGYTLDDICLPLSGCFIEPWLQRIKVHSVDNDTKKQRITVELSRLASIEDASKCSVITGAPGSGKTLALAKIALDRLIKASEKATRIGSGVTQTGVPVLITAKEALSLLENGPLESLQYPDDLHERIYVDTILVDGVDEIEIEQRDELVKKLVQKAKELDASLIVSSRTIDLARGGYQEYAVYTLLPFDHGQA